MASENDVLEAHKEAIQNSIEPGYRPRFVRNYLKSSLILNNAYLKTDVVTLNKRNKVKSESVKYEVVHENAKLSGHKRQ